MGGKHSKVVQTHFSNHVSTTQEQKIEEVIPENLWFSDANRIIWDYAFDYNYPDVKWLEKPFTFFCFPSSEKQILGLVCNAAPLDIVEDCIKKAYARGEKHLQDTLVKARALAIRNLDVDIRGYVDNNIKDAGMAETITLLGKKLFPHTFYEKLAANPVLFSENKQQTKNREKASIDAVNKVFDAIKRNDAHTNDAINIFKEFVRNNDSNPLNRLHLFHAAFDVFFKKVWRLPSKLPSTHAPDKGEYEKLANQFHLKIIEDILEQDLPPRIQQIIKAGANEAFNGYHSKKAKREMDSKDIQFNNSEVWSAAEFFKDYYETLKQHPTILSATHYEPYQSMEVDAGTGKAAKM